MPLDPRPDSNGNIGVVEWEGEAPNWPLPVVAVNPTRAVTRYRYLSHFVTCPNAGKHRRR